MPLHDLEAYPKPQSRAADALCREERLEDPRACGRIHARTRIRDGQNQSAPACAPVRACAAAHQQAAAVRHGVDRIADKIVQHLAYLALKAQNDIVRTLPRLDHDAGVLQPSFIDIQDGGEQA